MLQFESYNSRFPVSVNIEHEPNWYGTGTEPVTYQDYEYIEACQINGANISDIVSLIQTKTGLLQSISHIPECSYIAYPVSYTFEDYQISIHNPGDYLIWREDLQRFLVLNESIFLTLYKRV